MGETFYDVLGVGRDASQEDVAAAYRERVKETHPDLNDSPDATDEFQRVQAAEEVLGDPDERARYDRLGHAAYTSHFGRGRPGDGNPWNVGADPAADEARADDTAAGDGADATDAAGESGDRSATNGGFGFDPGTYDRTRRRNGDGNPSQRSYDVSDERADANESSASTAGSTTSNSGTAGSATTGSATAAGASTAGRAADGVDATGEESWRERAERTRREWSKAAQREARRSDDDGGGYSVHDWDDDELETEADRRSLTGSELVVVGITFLLYPFMAFSAVAPQFSLFVNVTVAVCALALVGYLLTMPRVGFVVFGAWSVISTAVVLGVSAIPLLSLGAVVFVGAAWIPFGYSVLFLLVLD